MPVIIVSQYAVFRNRKPGNGMARGGRCELCAMSKFWRARISLYAVEAFVIAMCVAFVVAVWYEAQRGHILPVAGAGLYVAWLLYKERKDKQ